MKKNIKSGSLILGLLHKPVTNGFQIGELVRETVENHHMYSKATIAMCPICGGTIFQKFEQRLKPEAGSPIIGPGSVEQYEEVSTGYYCDQCKLVYEFLPPPELPHPPS